MANEGRPHIDDRFDDGLTSLELVWVGAAPGPALVDTTDTSLTVAGRGSKNVEVHITFQPAALTDLSSFVTAFVDHRSVERYVLAERVLGEWVFSHGFVIESGGRKLERRGPTAGVMDERAGLATIDLVGDFQEEPPLGAERVIHLSEVVIGLTADERLRAGLWDDTSTSDACEVVVHAQEEAERA